MSVVGECVFVGGDYHGSESDGPSELPESEDFSVDDGPVNRYRRTEKLSAAGAVIYEFVGTVMPDGVLVPPSGPPTYELPRPEDAAALSNSSAEGCTVIMPDGWMVERLPIASTSGQWWLAVEFSGGYREPDSIDNPLATWRSFTERLRERVRVTDRGAPIHVVNVSANDDHTTLVLRWQFAEGELEELRVDYLQDGIPVAHEVIDA